MSVEMMSRKYDRHSSSSSESEKDDEFTSGKLVTDGRAVTNGNSYEPQVSAEERKSGVDFENFLEHNLDQAFQSKESVVDSVEGDKVGKVLKTGGFKDSELQKGVEEWDLNNERANDYWLERKNARSGKASKSSVENQKCEIIGERVSMSLHLQNRVEQKQKSSEVHGCLEKESKTEDHWKERKTLSEGSKSMHDEHEVRIKFPKAHRTVSWEYKTKDNEAVRWKEIDIDVEKVEEKNDMYIKRNEAEVDEMKKRHSTQSEDYHSIQENGKSYAFGVKSDDVLMQKKEKLEPSLHWEVVEIDIEDFSTETETYRNRLEQDHSQKHVEQPDLGDTENMTFPGYKEDVEERNGVGFEGEDKEESKIDTLCEKTSKNDGAKGVEDLHEEVKGSSRIVEGEQTSEREENIEEKNRFADFVEEDASIMNYNLQKTRAGATEEEMEQARAIDSDGVITLEKEEDKNFCRKLEGNLVDEKNVVRDEPCSGIDKNHEDEDVQRKRLSKRMELLLEKRKQIRQLSKDSKDSDLEDIDVNKKSKGDELSKEKEKISKRVRWKDIEDHIEDKYGDVILSEDETEEKLVKHEQMRKAELLLDRWQMKKQESEEQDVDFSHNSEPLKDNGEERNSESVAEDEEEAKHDSEEPGVDFEVAGEESLLDRTKTRVEDLEDSGDFSYNYWQVRKKARIGRRGHKKDAGISSGKQSAFIQTHQVSYTYKEINDSPCKFLK